MVAYKTIKFNRANKIQELISTQLVIELIKRVKNGSIVSLHLRKMLRSKEESHKKRPKDKGNECYYYCPRGLTSYYYSIIKDSKSYFYGTSSHFHLFNRLVYPEEMTLLNNIIKYYFWYFCIALSMIVIIRLTGNMHLHIIKNVLESQVFIKIFINLIQHIFNI